MRRLLFFLILCLPVGAQISSKGVLFVPTDPSGACANGSPLRYNFNNGALWGCDSGTWTAITGGGGGGGTVTSVGLALPNIFSITGSPVTTSGTLTGTFATETANTVLAGPTTGAAAAPTFRSLVTADMPAGTGTVTSIATTSPITGGTITTTGNLGCATCVTSSSPGAGVAHFAGSTQAVTSSAIVNADITNGTIDLTTKVTGALPVANGGTGTASTLTGLVRGSASAMTAAELSGDATTSGSNAVTVARINGTSFSGTNGDVVSFGASNTPADSGFLATNVVRKDTTNTMAAAGSIDASAQTGVGSFKTPVQAGFAPTANGAIGYDSTANSPVVGDLGTTMKIPRTICATSPASADIISAATVSTTETQFATTCVFPANLLAVAKVVKVIAVFQTIATASPTLLIKAGFTFTSSFAKILYTGSATAPSNATRGSIAEFLIAGNYAGTATSVALGGTGPAAISTSIAVNTITQPVTSVTTSGALTFGISATWSANTAGNSVQLLALSVEEMN